MARSRSAGGASPESDSPAALKARALRLLARREHSRAELRRKLAPHAADPAELEQLLDDLAQRGWLSEQRLVEQVIHSRRGRYGSQRIVEELFAKGVAGEAVAAALPQLKEGDLEAARKVWAKKFRAPPRSAAERARQVRFLQARGFALDTIRKVIEGDEE